MAYVQTSWLGLVAELGDEPGDHQGNVTVYVSPSAAGSEFTVPSADVKIAAEQGCLVGIQLTLADGRHMFVPGANVIAIVDGPPASGSKKGAY
jgi:hypothetical protein